MSRTALMTTTATLVALTVLAGGYAHTQTAPHPQGAPAASSAAPQTDSERNLIDMKALAEQGDRLKAETEAALQDFDARQRELETLVKDAASARQSVDALIKLLREAAGRLGPDSAYVKLLRQQEEHVRTQAADALGSANTGDHVFGREMARQAETIGALRAEAAEVAGRLAGRIDLLERRRNQIAHAYTIGRTDEFIKVARGYLDRARAVLQSATDMATKSTEIVGETIPSQ